ncbi:WW domain-containing oxidoreductase-like [Epargyreus clarus]|uniref:WW domain-containing oxidoreductase-like n=1 Tax=Epargyreus clarus TaxID=520877 RepID=UPI003C2D1C74
MVFTFTPLIYYSKSLTPIMNRGFNTVIWKEGLMKCSKVMQKNLELSIIHGPTADEVAKDIDLENKTCLITGANSGIGLEVTRCLNARDCKVLMACRNTYAASVVAKNVCEKNDLLHFYEVNLASLASVKNCCDNILKDHKKIDLVILNAATFGLPWSLTEDGLETTFQVNYLSQYYLLMNIENHLAPDARIVFTSTESHRNINWPISKTLSPTLDDLSLSKDEYTSIKAYNISKLCGILAMHYLGYRWLGTDKMVFCANPGSFVKTQLCRNWWAYETLYTFMRPFTKSIRQAASTIVLCAVSPELQGLSALYYSNCRRCEESDLAKDSYLSFKIQDLTRDILKERIADFEDAVEYTQSLKEPEKIPTDERYEQALVSNYSG